MLILVLEKNHRIQICSSETSLYFSDEFSRGSEVSLGSFNNYVDQILPNLEPLPNQVDNCGLLNDTYSLSRDFLLSPSPLLIVIE